MSESVERHLGEMAAAIGGGAIPEKARGGSWPVWFVSVLLILTFAGTAVYNRSSGLRYEAAHIAARDASSTAERAEAAYIPVDRSDWREEQSLLDQRAMVRWSFWLFLTSVFGTGVAGFGLLFLRGTLRAALAANQQALESTRVSREIGMAQVRAYLTFEKGELIVSDKAMRLSFEVVNCGQSPARAITVRKLSCTALLGGSGVAKPVYFRAAFSDVMTTFLGNCKAGGTEKGDVNLMWGPDNPKVLYEGLMNDGGHIYGAGLFEWLDVFDQRHAQPFKFVVFAKQGQFIYEKVGLQCDHVSEHEVQTLWEGAKRT